MLQTTQKPSWSPASVDESAKFYSFASRITYIGLPVMICGSYFLSLILMYIGGDIDILGSIPVGPIVERISDLRSINDASKYAYVGTLAFNFPTAAVIGYLMTARYFRDVVQAGSMRKIVSQGDIGIVIITAVIFFMIWIGFFMDLEFSQDKSLGMSQIFLWPIFPFAGSIFCFSASYLFFAVPAGIYNRAAAT